MVCGAEIGKQLRCRQGTNDTQPHMSHQGVRLFPLGQWSPRRGVTLQNNRSGEEDWSFTCFFLCLPYKLQFLCILYNQLVQDFMYMIYKYTSLRYMFKVFNSWWRSMVRELRGAFCCSCQIQGRRWGGGERTGFIRVIESDLHYRASVLVSCRRSGWKEQIQRKRFVGKLKKILIEGSGGLERKTLSGVKRFLLTAWGSSQTSGQDICTHRFFSCSKESDTGQSRFGREWQ